MAAPSDPLYASQWHFPLIGDIETIWDEYTGNGVLVGVYDDGIQHDHPDLDGNYNTSLHVEDDTGTPIDGYPDIADGARHGTAVSGIIAAEANNGLGGVGVAFNATLTSVDIFDDDKYGYVNSGTTPGFFEFLDIVGQATRFDIMSNSWGSTPLFGSYQNLANTSSGDSFLDNTYAALSANGRGGLGTLIAQAAGNDSREANGDGTNTSRHTITVAATLSDGEVASYSNYGASILVSAPAASYTSDITGSDGYSSTDFTSSFGGTSAATPVVSGVIALMLEANPDLGWRDVQNILALSAAHTGTAIGAAPQGSEVGSWEINGASNWNNGGLHFNGSYGYGMVDAYQAVRMAEAWYYLFDTAQTSANEISGSSLTANFGGGLAIPENNPTGVTFNITSNVNVDIEHIQLNLEFEHTYIGDLEIYLTAPDGTQLQVLFSNGFTGTDVNGTWTFGFDNFLGSNSLGTWTVKVVDTFDADPGTIYSAELVFYGGAPTNDDVYHYTDEFASLAGLDPTRNTLTDANGGIDWLNFSAFGSNVHVNLSDNGSGGEASLFSIADGTTIENVLLGDGNDSATGNILDNIIDGGAGNDQLRGRAGVDTITGGDGEDIIAGGGDGDTIDGGAGNDSIFGNGNGSNTIHGGDGIDTIFSGGGGDFVFGDDGNDIIAGQGGDDVLNGNAGEDDIVGGGGDDTINGGDDNDFLRGAGNNDTIHGDGGNDIVQGGAGIDVLFGDAGDDTLSGSTGGDRLDGGTGSDTMNGGTDGNRDTFVYLLGYEDDRVNGYEQGTDRLELDDALWTGSHGTLTGQEVIDTFGSLNGTGTIFTLDFGNGDILEVQQAAGITQATLGADVIIV